MDKLTVREINQALAKDRYVYALIPQHDGSINKVRIIRARTHKGILQGKHLHSGEWGCFTYVELS